MARLQERMPLSGGPMRADRLLSLLMLLQTRGQMTAAVLAAELEVSERTIYRDMEALGMAGVPVVAERGPGGGCGLLEGYRSDLTGLTAAEASALAALEVPAPLAQLGIGAPLRQALLKLLAAAPAAAQPAGAHTTAPGARLYVDPTPWAESEQPAVPLLADIYRAVMAGRRLRVARDGPRGEPLWLELNPHGLVSKEGRWYLFLIS
jgi:predicted DNA-binding transcriptional regulator YafY